VATAVLKLSQDGTRFSIDRPDNSTLTGYGSLTSDYGHKVHEEVYLNGNDVVLIDFRPAPYDKVAELAIYGPMLNLSITRSEQPQHSMSYVTLEDYLPLALETGAHVTYLHKGNAHRYPTDRCNKCNEPVYEWYGKRHLGYTGVRSDNNVGKEC
jgi:hypothetical protein